MNNLKIKQAASCLRAGGVVAYPTEAVWGLGCDPWNEAAVMRLLTLKGRPVHMGLILVAASIEQIAPLYAGLTAEQKSRLTRSWPGPHTWLLPDLENLIPGWIKGDHPTVAVRVSAHPVVKALCEAFASPVVSTSANSSGMPEIRSRLKLIAKMGARLDFVLPGNLGGAANTSTITDLNSGAVIR